MFGTYRTALALMVVFYHLLYIPSIGHYAVHGFFILSGYLMTTIMNDSYGYTVPGFFRFVTNRALRLYPVNFIILGITIIAILIAGNEMSTNYFPSMYIPDTFIGYLQNILLVYPHAGLFPNLANPIILPPTWALTLEIVFYLLIGLGLSRNRTLTILWFIASLVFSVVRIIKLGTIHDFSLYDTYYYIPMASLPFSIGSLIYYYQDRIPEISFNRKSVLIVSGIYGLYLGNGIVSAILLSWLKIAPAGIICFYLNMIIHTVLVALLARMKADDRIRKTDTEIGHYSYPFYLLHITCGFIVSALFFSAQPPSRSVQSLLVLGPALILMVGLSWLIIQFVDKPVNRFRKQFRKQKNESPAPNPPAP